MNLSQLVSVFELTVCFVLLIVLFFQLWPMHRLDSFRQNMFAVRDELFDYAANGHISFNDPAYKLLRQSMNGFIRYAHQLTFFRILFTFQIWQYTDENRAWNWSESWTKALKNIRDDEVRDKLEEFQMRSIVLVMDRIVTGSPLLLVVLLCNFAWLTVHRGLSNLKSNFTALVPKIGSMFVDQRILEEEAARAA